jgi:hypothetical protein
VTERRRVGDGRVVRLTALGSRRFRSTAALRCGRERLGRVKRASARITVQDRPVVLPLNSLTFSAASTDEGHRADVHKARSLHDPRQ